MNKNPLQSKLFNQENLDKKDKNVRGSGTYGYYLTNQNNLLEILSSGFLKPAAWIEKHYDDPGCFCPNGIPLLLTPPSKDLIQETIKQDDNFYPVLIQLNLEGISGKGYLINNAFEIKTTDLPPKEKALSLVLQYAIPIEFINVIYFRNFQEFDEYKLRAYDNVPQGLVEYQPKAEMFNNLTEDLSELPKALAEINEELPTIDQNYPKALNSIAGGQLLVVKLAEMVPGIPIEAIASVLQQTLRILVNRGRKWIETPEEFQWLTGIRSVLPEDSSGYLDTGTIFSQAEKNGINQALRLEWSLAWITMQYLTRLEKRLYSYEQAVQEIFSSFDTFLSSQKNEDIMDAKGIYKQIQKMINNVLDSQEDLNTYLETFPPSQFPASSALLLLSLRYSPDDVLTWNEFNPNLPENVLLMVTLFSGILTGRTLISLDLRSAMHEMTDYIDNMTVSLLNKEKNGIDLGLNVYPLKLERETIENRQTESLSVQGNSIFNRIKSLISTEEIEKIPTLEEEISKEFEIKKPELNLLLDRLQTTKLTQIDQAEYQLAIEICKELNWNDLVSTVLSLDHKEFALEYRKDKMEFRTPGFIQSKFRLRSEKEFKDRLKKIKKNELKKLEEMEIEKKFK